VKLKTDPVTQAIGLALVTLAKFTKAAADPEHNKVTEVVAVGNTCNGANPEATDTPQNAGPLMFLASTAAIGKDTTKPEPFVVVVPMVK
jgi:hypothetical protein